jgi:hypothetical protein
MAMNLKWSQQFQQYLNDFENKYSASKSHLSPLGFALSQKIIPMDQYLRWAQLTYHLPMITDDYFNTHLPSVDDWKNWKSEFQWSEEIVPIGLWDGHLLVACLEIPARFPASFYPVFLLADFKHTQRTYEFYINSEKGSESAKKLKEFIKPAQPEPVVKRDPEVLVLSDIDAPPEQIEQVIEIQEEQPEGLNLSIQPEVIAPNANPLTATAAPTEISFDNLDILSSPGKEEISLKFTNVEVNSSVTGKKTAPEPSTGLTNTGMTSTKMGLTANTTLTTVGSHLPLAVQSEINKGLPFFIAIKKDNPTNFENVTQALFAKSTNLFDKFILIALDSSELQAVPVSWSDNISPRSKDLEKLDLTEPSIFKTVANTLKSYHGYIVLNENNEKFFEFWNQGAVPGNITMVPLIVRNKLVGMWMGLGESNSYNWNTLKQMEARAKELCETFTNMYKDGAAASTDAA